MPTRKQEERPAGETIGQDRPPGSRVGDPGPGAPATGHNTVPDYGERSRVVERQPIARAEIASVVQRWAETLFNDDLDAHMQLYAPTLSVFHGRRNVSKESVRQEKERILGQYQNAHSYRISNILLSEGEDGSVVAVFRREWSANSGEQASSRSEQDHLTLRRIDGAWKIVGEA